MNLPFNTILQGDCTDVLNGLPENSIDMILTDPPYLVAYADRSGRSIAGDRDDAWMVPAFAQMYRVLKPDSLAVSFYGWSKADLFFRAWKSAGFRIVGHLTFPKRYTSSSRLLRYQHENAYLLAKGHPRPGDRIIGDVIDWTYSGNQVHPTQKPTSVLTPLIEAFCPRGGTVLDPFAGSGSTCIAARSIGRRFIGVEIDTKYHTAAMHRVRSLEANLAALAMEGQAAAWPDAHQGPRSQLQRRH